MNDETEARYAAKITYHALKRAVKAGRIHLHASLYINNDGVRVVVPVYNPRKDETMMSIVTTQDGRIRLYRSLQTAKNALHKAGITHYSFVRDGKECWS